MLELLKQKIRNIYERRGAWFFFFLFFEHLSVSNQIQNKIKTKNLSIVKEKGTAELNNNEISNVLHSGLVLEFFSFTGSDKAW